MELLRDRRSDFDEAGVQPVGISRDSPYTHVAWTQALDLNFPLLSDWNADATTGFGVGFDFRGLKDVSQRSAFLIGSDGVVDAAWSYETSEVPDFDEILAAVRAIP